jgi:hypothetical protein
MRKQFLYTVISRLLLAFVTVLIASGLVSISFKVSEFRWEVSLILSMTFITGLFTGASLVLRYKNTKEKENE